MRTTFRVPVFLRGLRFESALKVFCTDFCNGDSGFIGFQRAWVLSSLCARWTSMVGYSIGRVVHIPLIPVIVLLSLRILMVLGCAMDDTS